jgi:hypothetical protein
LRIFDIDIFPLFAAFKGMPVAAGELGDSDSHQRNIIRTNDTVFNQAPQVQPLPFDTCMRLRVRFSTVALRASAH